MARPKTRRRIVRLAGPGRLSPQQEEVGRRLPPAPAANVARAARAVGPRAPANRLKFPRLETARSAPSRFMTQAVTAASPAPRAPRCTTCRRRPASQLEPTTWREADNSLEVVWTTGSRRRAYDWFNDQVYEEELAVTPESVDMTRFQAGTVRVIDSHTTPTAASAPSSASPARAGSAAARPRPHRLQHRPAKQGVVGDIRPESSAPCRSATRSRNTRSPERKTAPTASTCRFTAPSAGRRWSSPSVPSAPTPTPAAAPATWRRPDPNPCTACRAIRAR